MNPEKNKANCKNYYQQNKDKFKEYAKRYRETHKKEISDYHKKDWQKNRDLYLARKKQYYQENKEYFNKKRMEYYDKNKESNQLYMRKYSKDLRVKIRSIILWYFGYRCSTCGYNADPRALQLDHINGGGSQEQRKIGPVAAYYYRKPQELFEKFQLLCANCNYIKRHDNDEW